jgi:hypothetical protein
LVEPEPELEEVEETVEYVPGITPDFFQDLMDEALDG